MASSLFSKLSLLLLLFSALCNKQALGECNQKETAEAEKAFKNCVESAQSGIIASAAKQERQEDLCSALDNMLSVCQQQTQQLADCKGREHAEHVKKLHLSSTADIVHSLNQKVNVEECSVFTRKTAIPARGSGGGGSLGGGGQGEDRLAQTGGEAFSAAVRTAGRGGGGWPMEAWRTGGVVLCAAAIVGRKLQML